MLTDNENLIDINFTSKSVKTRYLGGNYSDVKTFDNASSRSVGQKKIRASHFFSLSSLFTSPFLVNSGSSGSQSFFSINQKEAN